MLHDGQHVAYGLTCETDDDGVTCVDGAGGHQEDPIEWRQEIPAARYRTGECERDDECVDIAGAFGVEETLPTFRRFTECGVELARCKGGHWCGLDI